jgi:hypothetical protein
LTNPLGMILGNDPKGTPAGNDKTNAAKKKDNESTSKQRLDLSRPEDKKCKQTVTGSNKRLSRRRSKLMLTIN